VVSAQNYYGGIPAIFDDFSYTNTVFPIEGDSSKSLFGKNIWLTDTGRVSSRAWHRFNWGNGNPFGEFSTFTVTPDGIALSALKGYRFGSAAPIIVSGFVAKEGVYVSRVRFSSLSESTRGIQAFWLYTPDHYRFKTGNDYISYVNEVDFEWNNHFAGQGMIRMHAANIGAVHSKNGLVGKGREFSLFKKNNYGKYTLLKDQQAAFKQYVENKWWNYYIRIDSVSQTVEYYMESADGADSAQIVGGLNLSGIMFPMIFKEYYPRNVLASIYNMGTYSNTKDSILRQDMKIDVDWYYYTPKIETRLEDALWEISRLKTQNISRLNTIGIPLYHDTQQKMHTAEITGPDTVSPLTVHSWLIRPSLKGAQYDIEYRYRRLPGDDNNWIEIDYMEAQLFARAVDTAIEFSSTVKDIWTNESVTVTRHVSVKALQLTGNAEVFPNPTSGLFIIRAPEFLKAEQINVEIYSVNGRRVKSYTTTEKGLITVDLQGEPNGAYTILLKAQDQFYSAEILIQH
jgi:hypothetical protein